MSVSLGATCWWEMAFNLGLGNGIEVCEASETRLTQSNSAEAESGGVPLNSQP